MQLLFESSEEGSKEGLGWIPGKVKKFDFSDHNQDNLKIPHMGWNIVNPKQSHPLYKGLEDEARFYFVHSFHVICDDEYTIATAQYGHPFVCSVQRENILGAQFHPEKSHRFGLTLFKNFLEMVC
jgi:glutamine amidotransferase